LRDILLYQVLASSQKDVVFIHSVNRCAVISLFSTKSALIIVPYRHFSKSAVCSLDILWDFYTGAKTVRQKSTTGAKTEANCITHTHSFPFEIATEPLQIDRQNKKGKCLELNKEYVGVQFIVIDKIFIFISILEK